MSPPMKFSIEAQALKDSIKLTQAKRMQANRMQAKRTALEAKEEGTVASTKEGEFTWDISEDKLAPGMKSAAEKDEK